MPAARISQGSFFFVFGRRLSALLIALAVAAAVCLFKDYIALFVAALCFAVLVALSRFDLVKLTLAYILADHLCNLLKRAIYLFGDQPVMVYGAFQLFPALLLIIAVFISLPTVTRYRLPPSLSVLMMFVFVSTVTTLAAPSGTALSARMAGLAREVLPIAAVFVGIALPPGSLGRIAKLCYIIIIVSVLYGAYQFAFGPTLIDRVWANHTYTFSIEGSKVFGYISGSLHEFRIYSHYADHMSWGIFLVTGLVIIFASVRIGAVSRSWLYVAIPLVLFGIFITETRTVWVAFLGALGVHRVISRRLLRRPMLMVGGVLGSFAAVLYLGNYVLTNYRGVIMYANTLVGRYTQIGTIEARMSAWDLFQKTLPVHWLIGTGFGYESAYSALNPNYVFVSEMFSHNMFVDYLVQTGLPGLILLMAFFYMWFREAFWVIGNSLRSTSIPAGWIVALILGMLLTGCLNGPSFMSAYFWLVIGLVMGYWSRLRAEQIAANELLLGASHAVPARIRGPRSFQNV